jgi:hypothetical protein
LKEKERHALEVLHDLEKETESLKAELVEAEAEMNELDEAELRYILALRFP